jgi:hypothetical protein
MIRCNAGLIVGTKQKSCGIFASVSVACSAGSRAAAKCEQEFAMEL